MKKGILQKTSLLCLIFLFGLAQISVGQSTSWIAPEEADAVKNPLAGNADATKAGKKKFVQLCVICHGDRGKGDGIAGMALKPPPADFNLAKVQDQTDGAIFWKMTEGKAPMASYKDLLTEEERWQLVNYIRTFKK